MTILTDKPELQRALLQRQAATPRRGSSFRTGLRWWDAAAPRKAFARGAVHELLWAGGEEAPASVAMILAQAAIKKGGILAWCDPERELYLPALVAMGISARRILVLRPGQRNERLWAMAECLRCRGVAAVVARVETLSRVEARRLQLAAEHGGGVGIFLRPDGPRAGVYAAATRWRIRAAPGDLATQRWSLQLVHGHGGQVGNLLVLEMNRETRHCNVLPATDAPHLGLSDESTSPLPASPALAGRSPLPAPARATA